MSVVINTNSAATMAANNLAGSSGLLQRSLNRLSSGSKIVSPADDAGGLAVSMKLSAAAHRQGAATTNIGNAISFLQTQDGALKTAGKVLDRMGELKTLSTDPTKNSTDIANYNTEFTALKSQLAAIGLEKFNGIRLFGTSSLTVATTEDGGTSVTSQAANLLGTASVVWSSFGMSTSDWTASSPSVSNPFSAGGSGSIVTSGTPTVAFHNSGTATLQSNQTIGGPFTMAFDTTTNGSANYSPMTITAGGNTVDLTALLGNGNDHHVAITDDGVNASISIDGGAATVVASLANSGGGKFVFTSGGGSEDFHLANLTLTNTASGGTGNVADVLAAASLSSLALTSVTGATADVATLRAKNGASQSQLGFATELLSVNKANLEAATSRITDVDVAEESTQLARYNILVQSGTAMLSQANQSAQIAMKLLG